MTLPAYDAILLAGGSGRRMGGVDKAAVVVRGRPLGAWVRAALEGAARVVVVGPNRPWLAADVVTREDPPGAGPLAAVAAGAGQVAHDVAVVVAVDLPFLEGLHVDTLRSALAADPDAEVALAVDETGRDQPLLAAWRTDRLKARLTPLGALAGRPLRELFDDARACRLALAGLAGGPPPWFDCDTRQDLRRAERWI